MTLDGFGDATRTQAARADVGVLGAAFEHYADPLKIRVEAALGSDVGMAAAVAHDGLLSAADAYLGHEDPLA